LEIPHRHTALAPTRARTVTPAPTASIHQSILAVMVSAGTVTAKARGIGKVRVAGRNPGFSRS
jgi:hypothetical protein